MNSFEDRFKNPKTKTLFIEAKRFIKFSLVGVANTGIDFGLYYLLTRVFDVYYLASNAIAWMVAVAFSFTMNKFWTFRSTDKSIMAKQYAKFFIVSIIALGLSLGILFIAVEHFDTPDLIGKISAVVIVMFWNFFVNKFWTFSDVRKPSNTN